MISHLELLLNVAREDSEVLAVLGAQILRETQTKGEWPIIHPPARISFRLHAAPTGRVLHACCWYPEDTVLMNLQCLPLECLRGRMG
jgi:hypothetical protein